MPGPPRRPLLARATTPRRVCRPACRRAERYGAMLAALLADHAGAAHSYYFDVPFDVTVERHFTKPNHADWTVDDMRGWYVEDDVLPGGVDRLIGADSTEHDTVERVLAETGLLLADRPAHPSLAD
ncbi:hypothetical protein ABH935_008854 [Catenulispora sp. GAS73]|uniref:hypothetical protein n=1 Tax=Catenulispora sp. GAS73 TaxID=3156269 RepID=UPI0035118F3E